MSGYRRFGLAESGIVIASIGILFTVYVRWSEPDWSQGVFTSVPKIVFFPTIALLFFYLSARSLVRIQRNLGTDPYDRVTTVFEFVMRLVVGIICVVFSFQEF